MNKQPTPEALATLRTLTAPAQCAVILAAARGEEAEHFLAIIDRIHAAWQAMPKTYETDAQGRAALAQLHYFTGGCEWWIVEKDADPDHAGQCRPSASPTSAWAASSATSQSPSYLRTGRNPTSISSPGPSASCSPESAGAAFTGRPFSCPKIAPRPLGARPLFSRDCAAAAGPI